MIEVRDLSRQYGVLKAVDRVSFDIGRREIVGLLGHNGAGKTTIMKMLTGFLEPSGGTIRIAGLDIAAPGRQGRRAVQRHIGYLPENCPLYPDMTVLDHLDYQAALRGISGTARAQAIRRAIARTALEAKATAQVATMSRGYRQRLGVAQAILHEPDILVLDEPTNGLDPSQIQHMRELIRELAEAATVIVSTHILQEVDAICERVLIMRAGHLALDCKLGELAGAPRLLVTLDQAEDSAREALAAAEGVTDFERLAAKDGPTEQHSYALGTTDATALAPRIARLVNERGWSLYRLEPEQHDLEALFKAVSSAEPPVGAPASARTTAPEVTHV
ncbi:ATP-binding cassette domain-containing protein [Thiorhodovibrio frisius]|uniref:ABC-type multidrug transport system, ATPase component n=1 Tax=Thiorhodovibrio frisius TaxID=631362 RepID=H8YZ74_9GAMM|nr:ATP-binding cassette domain-containing protein [Thiorhodovibrio frisius]EIC22001.1 ABC-type multidrug transport system, ATPase component [Thiorhodovibrio frisius]WPL24292.1 putative ABC transporter ATP-binding protein YxlF [Thiorhodovibrio frisius]